MKRISILAFICGIFLLSSCATQSQLAKESTKTPRKSVKHFVLDLSKHKAVHVVVMTKNPMDIIIAEGALLVNWIEEKFRNSSSDD